MNKEYDFSRGVRGKFYKPNKVQKTIRLDKDIIEFFEEISTKTGIPYQTLINMSLRKFANEETKLVISFNDQNAG